MEEGKDKDKVTERIQVQRHKKAVSRAVSLSEHLNNGGNTQDRRMRALEIIQGGDLQNRQGISQELVSGLEKGWRSEGEVPQEQLDSVKAKGSL